MNMLDRSQAPNIKDAVAFDIQLKPYSYSQLDNGIPVYVIESNEQETIQVEFVFPAGTWYESANMVAGATNYLIKNGSSKYTALEINEMTEYYGAYLNRSCFHEYATYTLHCLSRKVSDMMPILEAVLLDPIFPEEELAIYQQNLKQRLTVNLQKSDFMANRKIDAMLFGTQHPYGRVSTYEAVDALHTETLKAFYKKHYTYQNCKIFIAGNVPENLITVLNQFFGKSNWNEGALVERVEIPFEPESQRKHREQLNENGVQGSIRMARPFPNRFHPDFSKMLVLNTIFGGYFGSRLMSNIREEKGYTYGIHSQLYHFRQSSAINIQTEAGKDVCEATIAEVYKEMERLRQEPIAEDELHLVRNFMIGSLLGDLDGAFQVIQRWKTLILNGLDEQYFYNNIQIVKSITQEELQALAQTYYDPSAFYELVVI
jgi:zinc protease